MMQATFEEGKTQPLNGIQQRTKPGDVWALGRHRLVCGDATNSDDVSALMGNDKIDLLLTDPPFFTPAIHYSGRQRYQRKFADLSTLSLFIRTVVDNLQKYLSDTSNAIVFCDGTSYAVFYPVLYGCFSKTNSLVWNKQKIGLGHGFRHQHELMIWAHNDDYYFIDEHTARADVFNFDVTPSKDRLHPVEKPSSLLESLIVPLSPASGVVCDLFGGGGGVLVSCEKLGRRCLMMELDPAYCDLIIARWEQATGDKAVKQ